ncbi:MAG: hypothetical protein C4551_10025 [Bacillota bacterium]|nr:MAG: hypothetical protein C4551_10025 [Bacillota bacterium]
MRRLLLPPSEPFSLNKDSAQAQGLVGWWPPLASSGASVLRDLSGRGRHGTHTAVSHVTTGGSLGGLNSYNGTTSKTDLGNIKDPTTAITLAIWVRVTTTTFHKDEECLVKRSGTTSPWFCYVIKLSGNDSTTDASFGVVVSGGYVGCGGTSESRLSANEDYLLLGTWKSGDYARWYINGVQVAQSASTRAGSISYTDTYPTEIGYDSAANRYTDAQFGDARIYNRWFSPTEVWQMYDPVTRWDLYWTRRGYWTVVKAPAGGGAATLSASLCTASASSPAGSLNSGSALQAQAATATAQSPAAMLQGGAQLAAQLTTASALSPAAALQNGSTLLAALTTASALSPSAGLLSGSTLAAALTTATALSPAASLNAGSTLAAQLVTATALAPAAVITAEGAATLAAQLAIASALSPVASLNAGSALLAALTTAQAASPAAALIGVSASTLLAQLVTASALAPSAELQSGSVLAAMLTTATALSPAATLSGQSILAAALATATAQALAAEFQSGGAMPAAVATALAAALAASILGLGAIPAVKSPTYAVLVTDGRTFAALVDDGRTYAEVQAG